jgi:hypothetical protein
VEEGSYFKFKYGKDEGDGKEDGIGLRAKLLGTGEREIVEASPMVRLEFILSCWFFLQELGAGINPVHLSRELGSPAPQLPLKGQENPILTRS